MTGSSEAPDSSQNTMTARRRRALLPDPRPVLGHPAGDGLLVTLDRAAGGALQPPAQPAAQQLPDVAGMVADPGQLLDHGGDAGQGPVVGVEAVRAGTLAQRLVEGGELLVRQARGVPGGAGAAQRVQPARPPPGVPAADVLAGHTELVGDLGLGAAGGEQRAGLHADCVRTPGGRADRGRCGGRRLVSCRHAARTARSCHRKGRTSLDHRVRGLRQQHPASPTEPPYIHWAVHFLVHPSLLSSCQPRPQPWRRPAGLPAAGCARHHPRRVGACTCR